MTDLAELYQEVILDHNRQPRNFKALPGADRTAEGYNPLCGDQITVYLELDGEVLANVTFQGAGCAISKASASMMTSSVKGKSVAEAEGLFERIHAMLMGGTSAADPGALGKLAVLSGVCRFPTRVKCATLAWHTLRAALAATGERVTTE